MQVNGHKISVSTVLSGVVAIGTLAGSWYVWGQAAGELKQKVQTLEERQKEDRKEARAEQREIKTDVKDVKSEVTQIRILLERMQRSK
jgi:uncharacterized protein HemX